MNLDISLGICVDNLDPFNYGRIRVVDYETYKAYSNAKEILSYLTGDNNGKYDEWLSKPSSTKKQPDPYLCESFLPNNLSTTPKQRWNNNVPGWNHKPGVLGLAPEPKV